MSQCKWNYFSAEDRSLLDFEMFDSASRSCIWAPILLLRLKHRHLASFGALILIVGLLTPTITQLAVEVSETVVRGEGVGEATLLARQRLGGGGDEELDWGGALRKAVRGDDTSNVAFESRCPSDDCGFPEFESLAICSHVNDITDKLAVSSNVKSASDDDESTNGSSTKDNAEHSKSIRLPVYNVSLPSPANCRLRTDAPFSVVSCKTEGSTTVGGLEGGAEGSIVYSMPLIYSIPDDFNSPGSSDSSVSSKSKFEALEMILYLCRNAYSAKARSASSTAELLGSSSKLASDSADRTVDVLCDAPSLNQTDGKINCEGSKSIPDGAYMTLESPNSDGEEFKASFKTLEALAQAINEETSGIYMKKIEGGSERVQTRGSEGTKAISEVIYSGDQNMQRRMERVTDMAGRISASLNAV